jgi:hypothetical protein
MNKRYIRYLLFGLLTSLFLAAQAFAIDGGPTFDLYETLENTEGGTPSEIGPELDISAGLIPGVEFPEVEFYVVLTETAPTNTDLSNWSDVVHFYFAGTPDGDGIGPAQPDQLSAFVQLFSDPAFNSLPVDDIISGNVLSFWAQETGPPTSFGIELSNANDDDTLLFAGHFNVWSDTDERGDTDVVPEPSTFLLMGAGLAGVGLLRRKFKS